MSNMTTGVALAQNVANETAQLPKPVLLAQNGQFFRPSPSNDFVQLDNRAIFYIPSQPCGLLYITDGSFTHDSTTNEVSNGTVFLVRTIDQLTPLFDL